MFENHRKMSHSTLRAKRARLDFWFKNGDFSGFQNVLLPDELIVLECNETFLGTFYHHAYVRKEVEEGRIGRGHCISNYSSALSLNGTENQSVIRGCVKNEMFFNEDKTGIFLSRKIF